MLSIMLKGSYKIFTILIMCCLLIGGKGCCFFQKASYNPDDSLGNQEMCVPPNANCNAHEGLNCCHGLTCLSDPIDVSITRCKPLHY